MGIKQGIKQAALFAAVALTASAPSQAEDFLNSQFTPPGTMLYISIPLGGSTAKDNVPSYGFALQGKRQYERVMIDSRFLNAFEGGLIAGLEAKWLIAGGLVAAAGVYALSSGGGGGGGGNSGSGNSGGGGSSGQSTNPPAPPPCKQTDPCKK
jgi:uncharacterized membrane protein YgcG